MDKGLQLYQDFIDVFVKMSKSCVSSNCVLKGEVRGMVSETGINDVLQKLNGDERKKLSDFVLSAHVDAIYATLDKFKCFQDCENMVISLQGEVLPRGIFESMPYDFIVRHDGADWPNGVANDLSG